MKIKPTNEIRWLHKEGKMILQQKWYNQWSDDYQWIEVPCTEEKDE